MMYLNGKAQLLFIGNDPILSRATASLLRTNGYKVRISNPTNAASLLRETDFSAVIFCATLSSDDMERLVEVIEGSPQRPPIVSIHLGLLGDAPHRNSSVVVDALEGPDALVRAVRSLSQARKQAV